MSTINRGSLVFYKGEMLCYQPNGSSCYLYENLEDVGTPAKSKYAPSRDAVRLPTINEMLEFDKNKPKKKRNRPSPHPVVPLTKEETVDEESDLERIVSALDQVLDHLEKTRDRIQELADANEKQQRVIEQCKQDMLAKLAHL